MTGEAMRDTQSRGSRLQQRIDELVRQSALDAAEIDRLRAQGAADRIIIDELRADGVVDRAEIETLEGALMTARLIGAAVGIVMERYSIDNASAFAYLTRLSQAENRKLREIAADLTDTAPPTG
jgi:hypothetical protein